MAHRAILTPTLTRATVIAAMGRAARRIRMVPVDLMTSRDAPGAHSRPPPIIAMGARQAPGDRPLRTTKATAARAMTADTMTPTAAVARLRASRARGMTRAMIAMSGARRRISSRGITRWVRGRATCSSAGARR